MNFTTWPHPQLSSSSSSQVLLSTIPVLGPEMFLLSLPCQGGGCTRLRPEVIALVTGEGEPSVWGAVVAHSSVSGLSVRRELVATAPWRFVGLWEDGWSL